MWIQVRSMDGKVCHRIDDLSKLTKIEELRTLLVDKFNIPVTHQRLFYRGKQLEDGHTLFDYDVGLNDIVQILARQINSDDYKSSTTVSSTEEKNKLNKENKLSNHSIAGNEIEKLSKYFKVGDLVDAKDPTNGAWFEAKIISIKAVDKNGKQVLQSAENSVPTPEKDSDSSKNQDSENDGLIYKVVFEDYEDSEDPIELELSSIRPRARHIIKFDDVKKGDKVMVNYNIEEPGERGFWYDCEVTDKRQTRTKNELIATVLMGPSQVKLEKCKIKFTDEIFAIEKNTFMDETVSPAEAVTRMKMPKCTHCKDIPTRKCKICSCHICGGKDAPDKQIMCDECDLPYHIWCLDPPLSQIPDDDDWYCPDCKNDETEVVRAGEKLKSSKKKSKMASANSSTSRDWGKGMACVGRTKECTIVPPNHFGPIPGVEVGTMWKFRLQVSESGVHRPHVAGIHGRENEGAYSIVLSGGYEDDLDDGKEFLYTGSGGRDLSGNKRCAEQSCDQTLTRMNKALAANCNVPLNKDGAEAKDWRGGKPVRVVRNCKGRKHSKYSPEEGNRYDGIYKVVKYWPEKGKSGFLVWRYLLRRDDPTPAPWTSAGKQRMQELGLEMQYPEGYLDSLKEKEKESNESTPNKKSKHKRKEPAEDDPVPKKKKKLYELPNEIKELIEKDTGNQKLWEECLAFVKDGQQEFLKKVEVSFLCICCQELVYQPITTMCLHNICKLCLKRSFSAKVYTCPMCRKELEETIVNKVNKTLQKILLSLYPGYDAGR